MVEQDKLKSPHWDRYKGCNGPIISSFPFDEGFPVSSSDGNTDCLYEILVGAERVKARVDYTSRGPRWQTEDMKTFDTPIVAAWREL